MKARTLESLIRVEEGDLVLNHCQFISPAGAEAGTRDLIDYKAASTRPRTRTSASAGLFATEPDRPLCLIADSTLVTVGSALHAELGRGLVALYQTAVAAGTDAISLVPARVARGRFNADLVLEHCTFSSESNIIRLGPWAGRSPGPDRPLLVTSRNSAFLGFYDRRVPETVLLRVDEESLAQGTLFWQGSGDAVEVDAFTTGRRRSSPHSQPRRGLPVGQPLGEQPSARDHGTAHGFQPAERPPLRPPQARPRRAVRPGPRPRLSSGTPPARRRCRSLSPGIFRRAAAAAAGVRRQRARHRDASRSASFTIRPWLAIMLSGNFPVRTRRSVGS